MEKENDFLGLPTSVSRTNWYIGCFTSEQFKPRGLKTQTALRRMPKFKSWFDALEHWWKLMIIQDSLESKNSNPQEKVNYLMAWPLQTLRLMWFVKTSQLYLKFVSKVFYSQTPFVQFYEIKVFQTHMIFVTDVLPCPFYLDLWREKQIIWICKIMLDNHVKIKGRNILLSLIKKWWMV